MCDGAGTCGGGAGGQAGREAGFYLWVPMVGVRSWCCGVMSVYECVFGQMQTRLPLTLGVAQADPACMHRGASCQFSADGHYHAGSGV